MNRAERAIAALRECAAALDELPESIRRRSLFGPVLSVDNLRAEADWIDEQIDALREATE